MIDIKSLAEEVTEGFSIVEGPKIVNPIEVDKFIKSNGRYHLPIYPTISRAFPVILLHVGEQDCLGHEETYFECKSGLKTVNNQFFPMNAQQCNAVNTIYKIETAGALVDALKKYAKGEENIIWRKKCLTLPIDTPDNWFINRMHAWPSELNTMDEIKNIAFTTKQLKQMPQEILTGAFYQKFKGCIASYVYEYNAALDETIKELRESGEMKQEPLRRLFQSCRGLYERGMDILRDLESTSLNKYPTWIASEGSNIQKGDYIQGIFVYRDRCTCAEGNVESKKNDKAGIHFTLENASFNSTGQGKGRLENLMLARDHWYPRIWKFEAGTLDKKRRK